MLINWKRDTAQYSNGWLGYFGAYKMFSLYYVTGSQSDDRKGIDHRLEIHLPGLKMKLGILYTIEGGKEAADQIFEQWVNNAGLQIKRKRIK